MKDYKLENSDTMKPFFTPAPGFALVEPQEEQKTLSHVQKEKEPPKKAVVLAVGDSTIHAQSGAVINSPVQVGDTILHTTVGYETLTYKGTEYRIIPFINILGTYDKNTTKVLN